MAKVSKAVVRILEALTRTADYTGDVEIWRKRKNQFSVNTPLKDDLEESMPAALVGLVKSHVIHQAIVSPRLTQVKDVSPFYNKTTYTGKSLYCDIDEDIVTDDYVVFTDNVGKKQVYIVEGQGDMDWVSPWSGMTAGKEVMIARMNGKRVDRTIG